jgi:thioredoxin-like negative regulator of GroEL
MILRRPVRHAVAHARAAHAAGDFAAARRSIEPVVVARGAPLEAVRGMAELEYLLGDYDAAEALLDRIVNATRASSARRLDAEAALALVHYRTGRYDKARGLFAGGAVTCRSGA